MDRENETLERLANLLAHVCGTSTVAVWACALGRLELRHSVGLAQPLLNAAQLAWRDLRVELHEGRMVFERGVSFVPLMSGSHDLVGLLAIPAAVPEEHPDGAYFARALRRIARYVQQPLPPPTPDLITVPLETVERPGGIDNALREVLDAVLVRHGWNVALVASMLGTPRNTLLRHLQRLNLKRPRGSTKARPRRATPATAEQVLDAARTLLWPRPPSPAKEGAK